MNNPIPFGVVFAQVEILFSKEFESNDTTGVVEHCDMIRDFIEACGWDVDEYIRRMMRGENKILN